MNEYIEKLNKLVESDDAEKAHSGADSVLCELLEILGYNEVVEAYHKIKKWYS